MSVESGGAGANTGRESDSTRRSNALQASEMRYRRLFESAKDGILILDAESGVIDDVNPFLLELTGYASDDFLGKHLWDLGPFKDIAASRAAFAELQATEYVRYDDLPLQARDGRRIDVEFVSNVYRAGDQDVIQCNIRDVTARRQADRRIAEQRATLEAILESAGDAIFSVDRAYRYTAFNRVHAAMVHANSGAVIELGEQLTVRRAVRQDARAETEQIERAMRGESFVDSVTSPDAAGVVGHFEVAYHPVRTEAGEIIGVSVFARDVTASKQAAAERERLEQQLRVAQKMEAIGRLAGGIAHDFNNLLSVILTYTAFVLEQLDDADPLRADLEEVHKAGNRAAALTHQLLAFGSKQVMRPVSLDLNQVMSGLEQMLRRIVGEDIELVQSLSPDLGRTMADPSQIEQIAMNLVVNARDAMPGGGKLTFETANVTFDEDQAGHPAAIERGSYVRLTVSDTGCGMDAPTRARAFEPFFTTKGHGKGTGLGLATVYGIVKQSGGGVWVSSEPDVGTSFQVFLPRTSQAIAVHPSPPPVATPTTGTETILVVEDEGAIRTLVTRILSAAGYTVVTATNGAEALRVCEEMPEGIDLVLTDVVMPEMNGRILAEHLAQRRPGIKVMFMSGYAEDAIVHPELLEAETHFLGKPFTPDELTRKVRERLDDGVSSASRSPRGAVA